MKLRTIIIGGAILSVIAGFTIGKTVTADAPVPGSSADPVVSKSYVDKALQDKVNELEKAVAELTVQAQALQNMINELQNKVNKTGGSTSGTTTPSQSTPTAPDNSPVGKTAYIIQTNTYVNLRSGPSTDAGIIKKVLKGEAMKILEAKNNWYRVTLNDNTTGWVAGWLVEIK